MAIPEGGAVITKNERFRILGADNIIVTDAVNSELDCIDITINRKISHMVKLWEANFESGNIADYFTSGGVIDTPGYSSTYCAASESNWAWVKLLDPPLTEFYLETDWEWHGNDALWSNNSPLRWGYGVTQYSNVVGGINPTFPDCFWNAWVGGSINQDSVATSSMVAPMDTWIHLGIYVKISATVGRIVLTVNGATAIDYTGNTIGYENYTSVDRLWGCGYWLRPARWDNIILYNTLDGIV